jgi:hypothetical protein
VSADRSNPKPSHKPALPVAELSTLSGWRQQRVTGCFDDVQSDDVLRIDKGLKALAALIDAGASESLVAAEFSRRGLGVAAVQARMAMIRTRQAA